MKCTLVKSMHKINMENTEYEIYLKMICNLQTMSAKQLKEELAKDQLNRKIDSTYERHNHRLGYLEARLDVGIAKLQVNHFCS